MTTSTSVVPSGAATCDYQQQQQPAHNHSPHTAPPQHTMADAVPATLKPLQLAPFAKRAAQLERFKPIITYWRE